MLPDFAALTSIGAFAVAVLAAMTMGFAIQRGGTCMVSAVDEAVSKRKATKLLALGEASLWVSGLLALAALAGMAGAVAPTYSAGAAALAGGILLGFGALANGACVFGSVARIGSRDWHFLLTPVGYFCGSLAHGLFGLPSEAKLAHPAHPLGGWLLLVLFLPLLAYRLYELVVARRQGGVADTLWHPHRATIVIGIAFVVLVLAAGPWTYPEALWRAAHQGIAPMATDTLLFLALLGGAVIGGWRGDTGAPWSARTAFACFGGGALMGLGSAMIPGGNDNLSLVGIPMLQPYAWLAIAAMAASIWAGLHVKARLRKLVPAPCAGDLHLR